MTKHHSTINPLTKFHEHTEKYPNQYCIEIHQQVKIQKIMLKMYDFLVDKGDKVVKWIEKFCVLTEGNNAGKPVKLLLWQKWFIYSIFCFYGNIEVETFDEDGNFTGMQNKYVRIVNDVLLMLGSGNAKTTLIAFILDYCMYTKDFPACKIYIGSNAYQQSRLCFDTALNIIKKNKVLDKYAKKRSSIGEIERTSSIMRAMSSDGGNLEGIIPAVLVLDEIHEMKTNAYASNLRKSTKRDDFLIFEMSTQGTVRGGYLDERTELAKNYLENLTEIEDYRKFFAIFKQDSIDEVTNCTDISILRKSNPSLGYAVSVELLKEKIVEMKNDPKKKVTNLTKNFNIPQNPITSHFTERECRTKAFDESMFINAPVFLGLDMAYTRTPESDLPCLKIMMVNPITDEDYSKDIYFLPKYWDKETNENGVIKVEKLNMIKYKSKEDSNILYNPRQKKYGYQLYADRGDLVIVDEELVEQLVEEFGEQARMDCTGITEQFMIYYIAHLEKQLGWTICKFGLDPNKAANIQAFADANIPSVDGKPPCIKFRIEDKKISNPIIEMTKDKRSRGVVHNNNKLTELHFAAAQAKETLGGIVFTNAKREKKDGVIAELAARSAYNVFINNKDTGVRNKVLLEEWWIEYGNRQKDIQKQDMEEN